MISLENKLGLKDRVLELKSNIVKMCELKGNSFGLNCLDLWNTYQIYMLNILREFPIYKEKNKINDENVEILEFLRICDFSVKAKGDFNKQKQLLISYANNILKQLEM